MSAVLCLALFFSRSSLLYIGITTVTKEFIYLTIYTLFLLHLDNHIRLPYQAQDNSTRTIHSTP